MFVLFVHREITQYLPLSQLKQPLFRVDRSNKGIPGQYTTVLAEENVQCDLRSLLFA